MFPDNTIFLQQILLNVWNENINVSKVSNEKINELLDFALKNIHNRFAGLQICNFLKETLNEDNIFYNV